MHKWCQLRSCFIRSCILRCRLPGFAFHARCLKNWLYKMSRVSTLLKFLLRSLRSRCMTFPTWLGCRICSDCKSLRSSIVQSSSRCRDQVLPEYALPTVSFYLQHTILLIAAGNQKFSHMSSSCASNLVNEVEEATRSLDAHARAPSWSL
jgi:hypothetical protein